MKGETKENWEEEYWKIWGHLKNTPMAKEVYSFIEKELQENNEKIIQKLIEFRDLRPNEKENSLDYWQGHTDAITKAVILLRNKDEK